MLVVVLSICPSVASFAADETTEMQESLPIPNPGPPAPEPRIDSPTPPEPEPKSPSKYPTSGDNADVGGGTNDGLESGPQMPDLGDSQSDEVEDSQYQSDTFENGTENYSATSPEAELLVKISNNQLHIEETIRRNQSETQKAIRILTAIMILTDLLLAMRIILLPIFESFQSKQDNANQEEIHLNNPEPSFDPDMMDK